MDFNISELMKVDFSPLSDWETIINIALGGNYVVVAKKVGHVA